ncbi:aminotransferase class V-fold PLP-dependent enzyme [Nafulsella turpanensis]|uniref:aminotransferase class V-fold PLP-dependent enzyme n=1 Tax=Nafulsella turpanensis TaxID=1265690 RepID=UPI0003815FD4|nr:aminotransferase class V-fold PLP-dependent enzyme [Nafulsella turpanensis]
MSRKLYFTAGPSALYFTAEEHLKNALREQIPSLSHRSIDFQNIYRKAAGNLRELLGIPEDYYVLFLSSGTEAWERLLQNCVTERSCHMVNGAFSQRFAETAQALQIKTEIFNAQPGSCSKPEELILPDNTEFIALTHNETSTGAMQPAGDIAAIRKAFPDTLLAVDVVSSAPYLTFPVSLVDSLFFSVQKGFGLPAGLGVWVVNERCLRKTEQKQDEGFSIGSYHSLPNLVAHSVKYQTPETPNVLDVYLLAQVTEDMNLKGIGQIKQETNYKAAVLYQAIEQCNYLQPFVRNKECQSKTTIVAELQKDMDHKRLLDYLAGKNMEVSTGYGEYKNQHIRIANFPTHSKEQIEMLADALLAYP